MVVELIEGCRRVVVFGLQRDRLIISFNCFCTKMLVVVNFFGVLRIFQCECRQKLIRRLIGPCRSRLGTFQSGSTDQITIIGGQIDTACLYDRLLIASGLF